MADSWLYGGVMGGQNSLGNEEETAMGIHVGTGILPLIGIEAGYWDLGSFDSVKYGGRDLTNTDASTAYPAIKPSIDFGPAYARRLVFPLTILNLTASSNQVRT